MEALWLQTCVTITKTASGKIFFICLLLRNIYVTLHGSQASNYFTMAPPTLEEFSSQRISAHLIPPTNIFSEHYEAEDGEEIDYDDSSDDDEEDNFDA